MEPKVGILKPQDGIVKQCVGSMQPASSFQAKTIKEAQAWDAASLIPAS